jgi:hypothetical protein
MNMNIMNTTMMMMMKMWIWIWICCCARVDACTPAPVRLLTAPLSKSVQDSVMTIMLVSSPRNVLVWNWSFTVSTACCNPETWYEVFFGGRGGTWRWSWSNNLEDAAPCKRSSTSNRFSAQTLLLELKDPKISRPGHAHQTTEARASA